MAGPKLFFTPVRRGHLITPFGVGAVMQARNGITVLVAGLPDWLDARPGKQAGSPQQVLAENVIRDPQLEANLRVAKLVQPPVINEQNEIATWFVPVTRFPRAEHCTNTKCQRVIVRAPGDTSTGRCTECEPPKRSKKAQEGWRTQQIALVMACEAGHLSDVDWQGVVHAPGLTAEGDEFGEEPKDLEPKLCTNPQVTYAPGTDSMFPKVRCRGCDAQLDFNVLTSHRFTCPGTRPWLSEAEPEACDCRASVIERTSSSLYYAKVHSALYLPRGEEFDHRLIDLLGTPLAKRFYETGPSEWTIDERALTQLQTLAHDHGIDADLASVRSHLDEYLNPVEYQPGEDRAAECTALCEERSRATGLVGLSSLVVEQRPAEAFASPHIGPDCAIQRVAAVPRLAETRVLTGFTRVVPPAADFDLNAGFRLLWGSDRTGDRDWLPAHRVFGEGIFLELNPAHVTRWEQANRGASAAWAESVRTGDDSDAARRVLVHTLAHALMRAAATQCGYALPSLRERRFVVTDVGGARRTALLIYTADGDAHGTLGGLVDLCRPGPFDTLVQEAIEASRWCGADPVCMDPPVELANHTPGCCHHCLLVPETSCEDFNKDLDRAVLVGRSGAVTGLFEL